MKVLGQGTYDTYICEVSDQELCMIVNGNSDWERMHPKVGSTIHVSKNMRRIEEVNTAQNKLDAAAKTIEALAVMLRAVDVVVPPTTTEGGGK